MTDTVLTAESTVTDRYQTTVPEAVRRTLNLTKRAKIRYTVRPNGEVVLSRAEQEQPDPVLDGFLNFLADDLQRHPERIQAIDERLVHRIQGLVGDIDVDLDAPLPDEDE
jgi:antitoxin PrlF|tara:strand:+ start:996 stop:1325 length:330 start_codon:yes stop_codon:yes gene_type:complete